MDEYTDEIITNKIYARPDVDGTVTKLFSTVFETPLPGDIMIEEGHEDHHAHVHLKYQLFDDYGRYNYRITDGQLELIPDEDKPPVPEPVSSTVDVLGAQVAQLTLAGMQKDQIINTLGAQLVQTRIDVMTLKSQMEGGE